MHLELVVELVVSRDGVLKTLALADAEDNLVGLGASGERVSVKSLPVGEGVLGEGLTTGGGTESAGETEGLGDGKVSLKLDDGGSVADLLSEHVAAAGGENTVDTTGGVLGAGDIGKVDGLEESGGGSEDGSVGHAAHGGEDLTGTTVNGISVEGDIENTHDNTTADLVTHGALLGGPLEAGVTVVLDLVKVLDTLGGVDEKVGASALRAEGPDLTHLTNIEAEVVGEDAGTSLELVTGANLALLNGDIDTLGHRHSLTEETVVLVHGLGQADHGGLLSDGLTVRDDGVRDLDGGTTHEVIGKILKANLEVQLTGTGNDVLTRLLSLAENEGVRLGETLETLNELGKILGVLDIDGDTHDGGHGVLHLTERVGRLNGGDGTGLKKVLIDTDEAGVVTGGHIGDLLDVATHLDEGTLDALEVEVLLLANLVVGAVDADLLASRDGTGEDTTEGVEATLVGGGNHLGNEHHEGGLTVTLADGLSTLVVEGTVVEDVHTVGLGTAGGGKVHDHHLEDGISGGEPLLHDGLDEGLTLELKLVLLELDVKSLEHLLDLLVLLVHDGLAELLDRLEDELNEGTLEAGVEVAVGVTLLPLLGGGVKEVVTPETAHHVLRLDTELVGVHDGELLEGETPLLETRTEGDGTLSRVNLDGAKTTGLVLGNGVLALVGGDDDVDGLDGLTEVLVSLFGVHLELKEGTVKLVDHEDGLDALSHSLAEHGLGLHTDTLDTVNNDEGTISDTESGGHLGGEIDVAGGVDEVDHVRVLLTTVSTDGGLTLDDLASIVSPVLLLVVLEEHGDTGGLDGHTTLLLILTGISETSITSVLGGNNTGLGHKGVGKSGLAVIDVGNDTHGADVVGVVHHLPQLVDRKVHHLALRFVEPRGSTTKSAAVPVQNPCCY